MEKDTLQLLLMVEGPSSRGEIIQVIGASQRRPVAFKLRGNLIEVLDNPNADASRVDDLNEGYLSYRYRVECSPRGDVAESSQVRYAQELIAALEIDGWKVMPCANFEDRL